MDSRMLEVVVLPSVPVTPITANCRAGKACRAALANAQRIPAVGDLQVDERGWLHIGDLLQL
jgi:hypothetical protein